MTAPRLFLVAPEGPTAAHVIECLEAACKVGDVASLLLPLSVAREVTPVAQALDVAVLTRGEPRDAMHAHCDGLHVEAGEAAEIAALRKSLGRDTILGVFAGASRHFAMEAAEAGADYVALDQNGPLTAGEPILAWCAAFLAVPTVAFQPVKISDLDTLLPQNPDFIRPDEAMWVSAASAARVIAELMQHLKVL